MATVRDYTLFVVGVVGLFWQVIFVTGNPVLMLLCCTMTALPMYLGPGRHRPRHRVGQRPAPLPSRPRQPEQIEGVEVTIPDREDEPVDQCEHQQAPAVEVLVDADGDFEDEVVAHLCSVCGAKVSERAAKRRNNAAAKGEHERTVAPLRAEAVPSDHEPLRIGVLRVALRDVVGRMQALASTWSSEGQNFVLPEGQHEEYVKARDEADQLKAMIDAMERQAEARRALGIKCSGSIEVPGQNPSSRVRRYAVPGECLCGGCPAPEVEYEEVRAYGSDYPVRRAMVVTAADGESGPTGGPSDVYDLDFVTGSSIRTGSGVTLSADGIAYDAPDS